MLLDAEARRRGETLREHVRMSFSPWNAAQESQNLRARSQRRSYGFRARLTLGWKADKLSPRRLPQRGLVQRPGRLRAAHSVTGSQVAVLSPRQRAGTPPPNFSDARLWFKEIVPCCYECLPPPCSPWPHRGGPPTTPSAWTTPRPSTSPRTPSPSAATVSPTIPRRFSGPLTRFRKPRARESSSFLRESTA